MFGVRLEIVAEYVLLGVENVWNEVYVPIADVVPQLKRTLIGLLTLPEKSPFNVMDVWLTAVAGNVVMIGAAAKALCESVKAPKSTMAESKSFEMFMFFIVNLKLLICMLGIVSQ